ncbi:probable cytochrome P450 313a4 [Condylostylus longicornis]|uniref:probable cytochrome P450 313a4 n=1 Tax=Condylostylus longicornis TaxID=2530218 RepID=UPI00244E519E|nr:probable cytochrome P450 313a4 [Condylostylus longicornis]
MNPKYQDILYEEIMSICPEDDIDVTYDHIRQMPYLEMVLNETMRLISTVALVGRKLRKDMILKDGLFLAEGTNIVLDLFHLHRSKKIWGPNVMEFNPDNFLSTNMKNKNPYSFIPFTKGIRNCVGWRYAMFSMQILLVHIIKEYEIKTKWKLDDLHYKMKITIAYHNNPEIEFLYRNKNLTK